MGPRRAAPTCTLVVRNTFLDLIQKGAPKAEEPHRGHSLPPRLEPEASRRDSEHDAELGELLLNAARLRATNVAQATRAEQMALAVERETAPAPENPPTPSEREVARGPPPPKGAPEEEAGEDWTPVLPRRRARRGKETSEDNSAAGSAAPAAAADKFSELRSEAPSAGAPAAPGARRRGRRGDRPRRNLSPLSRRERAIRD